MCFAGIWARWELISRLLRLRVNGGFGERFEVITAVHQGSVLSLLLFAIVMEIFS